MTENYIQYASGYNKDNITINEIEKAINDVQKMDDEHCAFWVSVITDDENVIETDKFLNLAVVFDNVQTDYKAKDWNEVKELYKLLLEGKFDTIRERIK